MNGRHGHRRKRCAFVRTTISLPWDLHRQMRHCGREVNWSAIAARAFAEEIGRRTSQASESDIEDVVARLRGTQGPSRSQLFQQGCEEGEKWARREATAVQLGLLHRARREARMRRGANHGNWLGTVDDQQPAANVLAKIIGREDLAGLGPKDAELWKSSEFVHGFAGGAIHIWKQVARRLRSGF